MLLARNSTIVAFFLCAALLGGCSKSEKGGPPGSEGAGDPEEAVKQCLAACEKQDVEAIWSLAPRSARQRVEGVAKQKGALSGKDFIEKNKTAFAEEAKNLKEAKIVERRSIPGATQFILHPHAAKVDPDAVKDLPPEIAKLPIGPRAMMAIVVHEDGGWKTFLPVWESIRYDGSTKRFVVQQDTKAELGKPFLEAILAKPRKEREQFMASHERKTITVRGTVKEVMPGNFFAGGGWFFYLDSPDAPAKDKDRLEIQVGLDKYQFSSSSCVGEGKDGVSTCTYYDGTTETIKAGQQISVTGLVWGSRGDWLGGSLLGVESAIVNK
jgi:hypothetical protein